jgi:hypothetical protein
MLFTPIASRKLLLVFLYSFLSISLHATAIASTPVSEDYIITLDHDTFPTTITDHKLTRIICEILGEPKKLYPHNILGFKLGDDHYDAGKAYMKAIGAKKWVFLRRSISGTMCCYLVKGTDHFNNNHPNGTYSSKSVNYTLYFLRNTNHPSVTFKKLVFYKRAYKKVGADCPEFLEAMDSDSQKFTHYTDPVYYYNEICGNQ